MINLLKPAFLSFIIVSCGAQKNINPADLGSTIQAATSASTNMMSQMLRIRGSEQMSLGQILDKSIERSSIFTDFGYATSSKGSVLYNEVPFSDQNSSLDRYNFKVNADIDCGLDYQVLQRFSDKISDKKDITIQDRVNDCDKAYGENKLNSIWSSKNNGIAGEGNWSLVASNKVADIRYVLMRDDSTGIIWTDVQAKTQTWNELNLGDSNICSEVAKSNKFGISVEQINWRLPTRGDFLQADINGARFTLRDTDKIYWSASPYDTNFAWSIKQDLGILNNQTPTSSKQYVRCVGQALNK